MRITEAARRLGLSPRMLRYRESLGLLPPVREPAGRPSPTASWPGPSPATAPSPPTGPGTRGVPAPAGYPTTRARRGPAHRQFGEDDLAVMALALEMERRLDVSPGELAFGIRVLAEPTVRAQVAGLARQLGRIAAPPGRALDFEQERALRLLRTPTAHPGRPAAGRASVSGVDYPPGSGHNPHR